MVLKWLEYNCLTIIEHALNKFSGSWYISCNDRSLNYEKRYRLSRQKEYCFKQDSQ